MLASEALRRSPARPHAFLAHVEARKPPQISVCTATRTVTYATDYEVTETPETRYVYVKPGQREVKAVRNYIVYPGGGTMPSVMQQSIREEHAPTAGAPSHRTPREMHMLHHQAQAPAEVGNMAAAPKLSMTTAKCTKCKCALKSP